MIHLKNRTHQLRLHMQGIGHAILGDTLYADNKVQSMSPRLCLHAFSLSFKRVSDKKVVNLFAPYEKLFGSLTDR